MIRAARLAELDEIEKVYNVARSAMAANGNPTQWGSTYPDRALLEEDICSNRLFVYRVNGRLEAVFVFLLEEDEPTYARIQGAWLDDIPYGTLHRLASAGTRSGVADEVLGWCLDRCRSMRGDTHADNHIMQHVFEKNGFVRCGIIHVEDGTPRIAYQRKGNVVEEK